MAFIFGGPGDDFLLGTDFSDEIHGNGGSDEIRGLSGNDMLSGGNDGFAGDILHGGDGRDTLHMGPNDIGYGRNGADIYVIHKAGPQGYQGNLAEPRAFNPDDGDKIAIEGDWELRSFSRGETLEHDNGDVSVRITAARIDADDGIQMRVRLDPLDEFYFRHDGTHDGAVESLHEFVEDWFLS